MSTAAFASLKALSSSSNSAAEDDPLDERVGGLSSGFAICATGLGDFMNIVGVALLLSSSSSGSEGDSPASAAANPRPRELLLPGRAGVEGGRVVLASRIGEEGDVSVSSVMAPWPRPSSLRDALLEIGEMEASLPDSGLVGRPALTR